MADDIFLKKAEVKIKTSDDSSKQLQAFINKMIDDINKDTDITVFFIDTPVEYEKFNMDVPGICLVGRDSSDGKVGFLNSDIVKKFNKSKTLKRWQKWTKGVVPGISGKVWYCVYVSAKDWRGNMESVNEEVIGTFDEETDLNFLYKKHGCIRVDSDGKIYKEVNEEVYSMEMNETAGLDIKKTAVNGKTMTIYINGKKYSYTPNEGTAKDMAAKFAQIAKHSEGKALAWLKKNATTGDSHKSQGKVKSEKAKEIWMDEEVDFNKAANSNSGLEADMKLTEEELDEEGLSESKFNSGLKKAQASFYRKMDDMYENWFGGIHDAAISMKRYGRDVDLGGSEDRKFCEDAKKEAIKLLNYYNKTIKSRVEKFLDENGEGWDIEKPSEEYTPQSYLDLLDDLETLEEFSKIDFDKVDLEKLKRMF